jgi:hypothetical protein
VRGLVGPHDFVALASLTLLLVLRVGGVNTVTGALLGGVVLAAFPILQEHTPSVPQLNYLLTGIAAVSIGRDPNGLGGRIAEAGARLRAALDRNAPPGSSSRLEADAQRTGSPELEEARLAGVAG